VADYKFKSSGIIFLVLGLLFLLVGCAKTDSQAKKTITDMMGREVEVPQKVERVVAVGPGSLRLLTQMQALDKVVGVEEAEKRDNWGGPYNLAHPELQEMTVIGPPHGGDAELIVAQSPDLIFFYGDSGAAKSLAQKTDIPVVGVKYVDLGPIRHKLLYQSWQLVGELLNKEERAQELIDYTEGLISDLKERTADVAQQQKVSSVMISQEKLIDWDPEIIFVDEMNLNLIIHS
jgi:iron complex transport system substrate-binding protein